MSHERLKCFLFIFFCLTTVWFLILLICLPEAENELDQVDPNTGENRIQHRGNRNRIHNANGSSLKPFSFDYSKPFLTDSSITELLFHEFKTSSKKNISIESLTKAEHDTITQNLGYINGRKDELVKQKGDKLFAFNLLVSNRIGSVRKLPDTRHRNCPRVEQVPIINAVYQVDGITTKDDAGLKASIIICYYNEAPSALLRTINSIILRSPDRLVEEIIVVDDYSQSEYKVEHIRSYILPSEVKILTTKTFRREGLIRARLYGASLARGGVLIFLDSHVEANVGWLEPLMSAVQENTTTIACPMIDLINAETLIYSASPMVKGGLDWALNFKWDSVPSDELKTTDDFIKPINSPTMAGGLYAINREYFYHLGSYDRKMELWGGENVEMSLRVWLCGGRIQILPCSRLGHIFRKTRPYGPELNRPDSLLVNSLRTAKVWLGDYIERYYDHFPHARHMDVGDVEERAQLRKNLNCHNFSFFLDQIYPQMRDFDHSDNNIDSNESRKPVKLFKTLPRRVDRSTHVSLANRRRLLDYNRLANVHAGQLPEPKLRTEYQIQLTNSNMCLRAKEGFIGSGFRRLILDVCASEKHTTGNEYTLANHRSSNKPDEQFWIRTEMKNFRLGQDQCLDLLKNLPVLRRCHKVRSTQAWNTYNNQTLETHIYNSERRLCLAVEKVQKDEPVIVTLCDNTFEDHSNMPQKRKMFGAIGVHSWSPRQILPNARKLSVGKRTSKQTQEPYQRWNILVHERGSTNHLHSSQHVISTIY